MNNADIEIPRPERLETSFRIFVDQAGYLPTCLLYTSDAADD